VRQRTENKTAGWHEGRALQKIEPHRVQTDSRKRKSEGQALEKERAAAAPQLDVVCRPNFTQKIERSGQSDAERERLAWRKAMWTDIHDAIAGARPPFSLSEGLNQPVVQHLA